MIMNEINGSVCQVLMQILKNFRIIVCELYGLTSIINDNHREIV